MWSRSIITGLCLGFPLWPYRGQCSALICKEPRVCVSCSSCKTQNNTDAVQDPHYNMHRTFDSRLSILRRDVTMSPNCTVGVLKCGGAFICTLLCFEVWVQRCAVISAIRNADTSGQPLMLATVLAYLPKC